VRRFVIQGFVLIGLVACAAMVFARPADKPKDKEPPAGVVPEDAIIAIYARLSDAMEKSPSHILLTPEKYQALLDDIKRLERLSSRTPTRRPARCAIKGKVAGNLFQFTAEFEFDTEKAGDSIRLGCGLAQATGVSLDGRTPRLRRPPPEKGDSEGFVVEIDKPGEHLLTLDLVMAITSKSLTQGLMLDLPRAAVTTIDLELPDKVRDVRLGGKLIADTLLTLSKSKLTGGLGPAEKLELTWQQGQAGVVAAVFLAKGAITARLDGKELNTEATLNLRVQSGQVKQWRLLVPPRAELKFSPEDQSRIARIEKSDQKQTSLFTIHLKELTSDPLGVVITHSQPAPKPATGKAAPLGPFVVLGAARHAGSLLVCNSMPTWHPEFTAHADLTRRSVSDEEQRHEPTCVAAFRYGPGAPTSDKPGSGAFSWLDVEVELVRGQIKTKATHKLQLKSDTDGGHWRFLTSLEITPRWADIDRLTVQLPPGCTLREEGHFPLPDRVQSISEDPATHVVTISLARGTKGERSLVPILAPIVVKLEGVFTARVDLEVPGKGSLGLPVPIGAVQGEGTITVTTPSGVELLAPDEVPPWAGLEVLRQANQEVVLRTARQAPASLAMSWRPHRPDVVVANSADVTLAAGEVRVRQELRYSWPAGPAPRLKLRVPAEIAASLRTSGGRLVGLEGEPGAGGVKGLIPVATTRQGQELLVVFEYRYALRPARPGATTLPLITPLGVARGEARVRLWSDPGHLPGPAGDWAEQDIEVVPGRSRLPVLVLHSSRADSPLRVTLSERSGLFALVDRSLVRVEVGSNGTQTYRVGYRLVRLEGRSLDFELPAPAPTIQLEARLDGRRIDYELLPADDAAMKGRIVRLRLSPELLRARPGAKPGAALLEIAYHLDPDRMRGSAMTTPLVAPKLMSEPGRIPTRWSVVTPPSVVILGPEAGPATPRTWAQRGWLLAPRVDVSAAELERWLLDADPPSSEGVAAPSLVLWHDGASPVQLTHVPQRAWLLVCSPGLVLLGLLLARLVLNKEGGPSGLRIGFVLSGVAVTLVVAGLFVPNLVGQLAYGCQPGILVLVVIVGVQRLLHERYRRQIVFLPSFTRSSRKGSSLHRAEPRPPGQPSTVDAPRPIGSSIDRIV
jgi:hypothetical protein